MCFLGSVPKIFIVTDFFCTPEILNNFEIWGGRFATNLSAAENKVSISTQNRVSKHFKSENAFADLKNFACGAVSHKKVKLESILWEFRVKTQS